VLSCGLFFTIPRHFEFIHEFEPPLRFYPMALTQPFPSNRARRQKFASHPSKPANSNLRHTFFVQKSIGKNN
jgi:hypothetical protein